jgi:hypothetical protein
MLISSDLWTNLQVPRQVPHSLSSVECLKLGLDVGPEVGLDVGLDVGLEVGPEVGLDVGLEVGLEVGPENKRSSRQVPPN